MTSDAITRPDQGIPVIDISPLVDEDATDDAIKRTAERIGKACEEVGFFYVSNHGIPERSRESLFTEAKRFFDLAAEEKMGLHMGESSQFRGYVPLGGEVTQEKKDWHECLDLQPKAGRAEGGDGGHLLDDPGQWPAELPSFRQVMMRAWDELYELSGRIARGLALSLGAEADFFDPFTGGELSALRLAHYPPFAQTDWSDDVDAGMGAHCDKGFLAILQQDEVGGLEVRGADGQWITAPHVPGTFLVNVGFMTQRWSNDRYQATWHRVQLPGGRDRYSVPFFFEPRADAVVEPLASCCDADNPPRYEPCKFGEYLDGVFSKAYGKEAASS